MRNEIDKLKQNKKKIDYHSNVNEIRKYEKELSHLTEIVEVKDNRYKSLVSHYEQLPDVQLLLYIYILYNDYSILEEVYILKE